jgi:hypothetical protein
MPSLVGNCNSIESLVGVALASEGEAIVGDPDLDNGDIENNSLRKNMNYTFALSRCSTLCKTAGHDKQSVSLVISLVDEATEGMRQGLHISHTSNLL